MSTDETPAPLDIDAIAARADAAEPGPWAIYLDPMEEGVVYSVSSGPATEGYNLNGGDFDTAEGMTETDADFIAHAREDVPALVAEDRRLREQVAAVRAIADEGRGCERFTGPSRCADDPSLSVWAPYGADRYCDQCRIRAALDEPDGTRLAGSTATGDPAAWPSTAGEFAARWNAHTPEQREERARAIITALQEHAAREERPTFDTEQVEARVDNASRPWDATDDAGYEHRDSDTDGA